jgi:hypothetical protein
MLEATGLWSQTVRFDGELVELGPRAGGVASYRTHPGSEARTEVAFIWVDEIRKVRLRKPSWWHHGYLRLVMKLRRDETSKPFWWTEPGEHPRIANIVFTSSQLAAFEALRDAIEQARHQV